MKNSVLQSAELSAKEKGVLATLLSLPEDWQIYKGQLHKFFTDGRDGISSAFNKLVEKKFIFEVPKTTENGKFSGVDYVVFPEPVENPGNLQYITETAIPETEITLTENPLTENPLLQTNTKQTNNNKQTLLGAQTEIEISPTFDDFYELGLPKTDRARTLKYWKKMSQKEKETAIQHAAYLVSITPAEYRPGMAKYLCNKMYNDEIIDRRDKQGSRSGAEGVGGRVSTYSN